MLLHNSHFPSNLQNFRCLTYFMMCRKPSIQENVILVVMHTLTFVENVSLFMFHPHHPQQHVLHLHDPQHVLHHHLGQLHLSVQLNARMPSGQDNVTQVVINTMMSVDHVCQNVRKNVKTQ